MDLKLYIYSSSSSSKGNALELTTEKVLERVLTEKDSDNKDVKRTYSYPVSLTHLDYEKKIYEPCVINAFATVGKGKTKEGDNGTEKNLTALPTHNELVKFFSRMKVELVINSSTIATNYFVFKVRTKRQKDSSSSVNVELEIYSEDKLLTLEKYSKAYTAKKLGEDIFKKEIVKYDITNTSEEVAYNVNLQMLAYKGTDKDGKSVDNELRQPYLVQYNETFYDFIRRTANRCGEFLYFENGKLNLGLTQTDKSSADYLAKAANYHFDSLYDNSVFAGSTEVEFYNHNYLNNTEGSSERYASAGKYHYSDPLAADEYLDLIGKEYTNWVKEQDWRKDILMHMIKALSGTSLSSLIANFLYTIAEHNIEIGIETASKNDEHQEENIKDWDKDDLKDQWSSDGENLSQFGTASNQKTSSISEDAVNMNAAFYSMIRQAEKKIGVVGDEALFIDFGSSPQDLKLGDIIIGEGSKYLVFQVKGSYEYSSAEQKTISTQEVVAIPLYEVTDDTTTNFIPVPPALPQVCVRESQPQLAFIANCVDPRKIGRVRIRFAWQEEEDDASPWVRVALPFATDGGGVKFKPEENDEVLVSFEEGNVERPYVSGYLLSERCNESWGSLPERSVTSRNGHGITFNDNNSLSFLTNLVPAANFITSFIPESVWPDALYDDNHVAALAGGMTLRDQYGLYEISMSSDERSISIQSSLGNVELNAFTGITISSPTGDIKIEGKNVEISASNKVSITSGKALEDRYVSKNLSFFKGAVDVLTEEITDKILDLTLWRTLLEVFLRPIDGTTSIKSFTFVQVEAGKGSAEYPVTASVHQKAGPQKLIRTVNGLCSSVDNQVDALNTAAMSLKTKIESFEALSGANMTNKEEKIIKFASVITNSKSNTEVKDSDYTWTDDLKEKTFDKTEAEKKVKDDTKLSAEPKEDGNDANNKPYKSGGKLTAQFQTDKKKWEDSWKKFVTDPEAQIQKDNEEIKKKKDELTNCVKELWDQYRAICVLLDEVVAKGANFTGNAKDTYQAQAIEALKESADALKPDDDTTMNSLVDASFTKSTDIQEMGGKLKTIWKRRAVLSFLSKVKEQFNKDMGVTNAIATPPDLATAIDIEKAELWASYVDLALNEATTAIPATTGKKIKQKVLNNPFKDWFMENYLDAWVDATYNRKRWATGSEGKILLSDSPDSTINIKADGTIDSCPNATISGKYVRVFKNMIKNI